MRLIDKLKKKFVKNYYFLTEYPVTLKLQLFKIRYAEHHNKPVVHLFNKKHQIILDYLNRHYKNIDQLMNKASYTSKKDLTGTHPIWIMWQQGFDSAPEVVKICRQSLYQHINNHMTVVELDDESVFEYIDLPDYIIEKYQAGKILRAQFADIIRIRLLATYGGLWLDSTVFVSKKIPENIFDLPFFSPKSREESTYADPSNRRWVPFILGGGA